MHDHRYLAMEPHLCDAARLADAIKDLLAADIIRKSGVRIPQPAPILS
jgi:hypothetical protein